MKFTKNKLLNNKSQTTSQKKSKETIIELCDVWKIYDMGQIKVNALKGINLSIRRGDFVSIIGASGSGKSTIMNLLGCLDIPTKGEIYLENNSISSFSESDLATFRGEKIGFIFQQYNLIQNMSVFENIMLPLEFLEINDDVAVKKTIEIIKMVGLKDKINNKPNQLSGGQQQRVSIARCLVTNPDIILADEPTGALDSVTGKEILSLLIKLWKDENKTIILVTHDMNISKYAKRIIELKDGLIIKDCENQEMLLEI